MTNKKHDFDEEKQIRYYPSVTGKTSGECKRNNWNSINLVRGIERTLRIQLQNQHEAFDKDFYQEMCWNEEAEKILKKRPKQK